MKGDPGGFVSIDRDRKVAVSIGLGIELAGGKTRLVKGAGQDVEIVKPASAIGKQGDLTLLMDGLLSVYIPQLDVDLKGASWFRPAICSG